jgi:dTDP-4-dehydrorhamnose reductase
VTGAAGQLGRELAARLGPDCAWAGAHDDLDVADAAAVEGRVAATRPDVIFNAAAYNRVDAAETEVAAAVAVNAVGPGLLARSARRAGALLVHVSTDYVFDGAASRPYAEADAPRPLSAYGASKLAGELLASSTGGELLVVRTSGVFARGGSAQKGGSFVDRIVAQARAGRPLRVVDDQVFSPTYAPDLAEAILALVRGGARGLVHVTNAGSCSWHAFARSALACAGIAAEIAAIRSADLGALAVRPAYSVLDNARCRSFGLPPLRSWNDALADCLAPAAVR